MSIGGSFLFFLFMFFSILGIYGTEKNAKWAISIYKNATAIYCIGFVAVFVVAIVALATKDGYGSFSKASAICYAIISLPYAVWMGISFYFINK